MSRCVYVIINHDTNQSYAGLTKNVARRVSDHRRIKPHLFQGRHQVLQTDPLSDVAAQIIEGQAVRFLRAIGFQTLNVKKTGSLGSASGSPWTKETCADEAKKYTTRKDFERGTIGAYVMAQRRGWLPEICSHMHRKTKPNGYWTKDRCAIVARKYGSRIEFSRQARGVYNTAHRNGWLSDICAHMARRKRPNGYWTKERCAEVAARYMSRADFMRGAISVYNITERRGWMKDICRHMTYKKRSKSLRRP